MASECLAASGCGTRMWSSARSPGPMQVAAARFTPASLTAAATRASAPGVFSMSMTRSYAMWCARVPAYWYGRTVREISDRVAYPLSPSPAPSATVARPQPRHLARDRQPGRTSVAHLERVALADPAGALDRDRD